VAVQLHNLPFFWRAEKTNLLAARPLFYGAWKSAFVPILIGITLVDWLAAAAIHDALLPARRRGYQGRLSST